MKHWSVMLVAAVACAAPLAAPAQPDFAAKAESAVRTQLHDPGSAVFRGMQTSATGDVCGEVDSRNIEGGRTGFARFLFDHQTAKAALALHDPDFHQFFAMDDNEYTNGNAAIIADDACSFVKKWVAMCPVDMAREEIRAKSLCTLYNGGSKGRARLKTIIGYH